MLLFWDALAQTPLWLVVIHITVLWVWGDLFNFWSCCSLYSWAAPAAATWKLVWAVNYDPKQRIIIPLPVPETTLVPSRNGYWSRKDSGSREESKTGKDFQKCSTISKWKRGQCVYLPSDESGDYHYGHLMTNHLYADSFCNVNFWWPLFTDGAEARFRQPGAI